MTAALLGNLFVRCVVLFVEAFMDNYNLMLFAVPLAFDNADNDSGCGIRGRLVSAFD